ncbi:hypothetical protein F2Q69_00006777 [Brassica cretica]|uniref:Retrotransposon gag domain-containing protein n=1 Tax=Brassica cretica TaxID=69181 RepID=A0A8S9P1X5_BRACR|nr:hypothetical protein F2Q69_00006777 [Brassica cretica]
MSSSQARSVRRVRPARSLRNDRARAKLGRYMVTEHTSRSVATYRPSVRPAPSLRTDRARAKLGRYVATECPSRSVATANFGSHRVPRNSASSNRRILPSETKIKPSTQRVPRRGDSGLRSAPCRFRRHPIPGQALGGDASTRENAMDAQTYEVEDSESEPGPNKEALDGAVTVESPMIAHLHQMFSERLDALQSMVERLPGKVSFFSIKAYDGTTDPDNHVTQYRQRKLAVALPKGSREATMCKGFGSTMIGPALQCFSQEKVAIPKCSIPTAISSFKRGLLPDGDLYKELTKYQCKTMEDVLSQAWAHVKWEKYAASRDKAQQKQDPKTIRPDRTERDEKHSQRPARDSGNQNRGRYQNRPIEKAEGMAVSTWPDISHLSVSRQELINVLRQMGQQEMKAPDSFRNPGFWCDFHRDHGHKTEDCVALKIEFNELLKKGHLREFLSEKAKSHLRKETTGKPTEVATVSSPRQDRVIHVISGGERPRSYSNYRVSLQLITPKNRR